ncbi:MAG: nucleotidyltransferase domain-containing protein [Candidatus Aenigmatarchaeota archaeon]
MIYMDIFDILGKKSPNRILKLFVKNPTAEMQLKHIESATKLAKLSVLKWTKEMARQKLLTARSVGRTTLYTLNRDNPSVKQLRILHNIDYINSKLGSMDGQVFLYGSFARGENVEKSDIDLLVIGKNRDMIKKLKALDDRIKVSFYTPLEWSMAARKDKAFFDNVEKDKIRVR